MEMEHINENTIRVLIDNEDLEDRGITVLDLLGNQNQIESFFYSILEEVDIDETFRENDMITFQVVPSKTGLELYISKDGSFDVTPFTQFNQLVDKNKAKADEEDDSMTVNPDVIDRAELRERQEETVFVFDDFEEVITFAHHVYLEDGISFLHVFEDQYYITLVQFVENMLDFITEAEIAMALEFGNRSAVTFAQIEEYGKELMRGNALDLIREYFTEQ